MAPPRMQRNPEIPEMGKVVIVACALVVLVLIAGYELSRLGILHLTPYTVAEGFLSFSFPIFMFVTHGFFRSESLTYAHIGRELSWLGLAVIVSLVSIVLGTRNLDLIAAISVCPVDYRPIAFFVICVSGISKVIAAEVMSRRQHNLLRVHGRVHDAYSCAVLVVGICVYMCGFVLLVSHKVDH